MLRGEHVHLTLALGEEHPRGGEVATGSANAPAAAALPRSRGQREANALVFDAASNDLWVKGKANVYVSRLTEILSPFNCLNVLPCNGCVTRDERQDILKPVAFPQSLTHISEDIEFATTLHEVGIVIGPHDHAHDRVVLFVVLAG